MFWASTAGNLVAKIALAVYEKWLSEQRIRNEEAYKMGLAALTLANRALAYKTSHPVGDGSDLLDGLQRRDGAPTISIRPTDPPTTRP